MILVAPYWNLNDVEYICRFILLCILVAPYWNLNAGKNKINNNTITILVAPYWNLNDYSQLIPFIFDIHISSSILRFKYYLFT